MLPFRVRVSRDDPLPTDSYAWQNLLLQHGVYLQAPDVQPMRDPWHANTAATGFRLTAD